MKPSRRILPCSLVVAALGAAHADQPLAINSRNPYLLEYRGEMFVGRTFGEHYGSVIHADFDFVRYLDALRADGLNLTRVVLLGFRSTTIQSPLSPPAGRFLQPWQRSSSGGPALDGLGKWDFSQWNEAYFARLRDFAQACRDRGIVAELCLFNTFYDTDPGSWTSSPFHPSNNVQGYGPSSQFDAMRATDANLTAVQEQVVRRIVRELNGFGNVYYEIQNEPFWNQPGTGEAAEVAFHNQFLTIIRNEEASLPHRHLVAHNFPGQLAALSNDFDLINGHYPFNVPSAPWVIGGESLLANEYGRVKPLALDESSAYDATSCRLEAWMFILGGGAIYNGLDSGVFQPNASLMYSMNDPSGNLQPGIAIRGTLNQLGTYLDSINLHDLRRDASWIAGGLPSGARSQAMANPGQQYVAYFHHGAVPTVPYSTVYTPIDASNHVASPQVNLPQGSWRVVWTKPSDLTVIGGESFTHAGGIRTLQSVTYQADVALKIERTDAGDTTPPPQVRGLSAQSPVSSSVSLSWRASPAADLASYRIYHGGDAGVAAVPANRIAEIPGTQTGFVHAGILETEAHFFRITAVDSQGNESEAGIEVVSKTASSPLGGLAREIPGMIQCEDFDSGGNGVAYQDLTPGNSEGASRPLDHVDLVDSDDGGIHLTHAMPGERLRYSVRIAKTDTYDVHLRCRAPESGASVRFLVDGEDLGAALTLPSNPSWQTISLPGVLLTEGARLLEFVIESAGSSGLAGDFNWISITPKNRPGPIARAGWDRIVSDDDWNLTEAVSLDASSSSQGDQPIVSHTWWLNSAPLASGSNPTALLTVGRHRIRLTTMDAAGLADEDEILVEVQRNSFVNGGFENGLAGWQSSGNAVVSNSAGATQGTAALVFGDDNSASNGAVTQGFPTTPGQTYRLSFDIGVRAFNTLPQSMAVKVSGNTELLNATHGIVGIGGGNTMWSGRTGTFTADNGQVIVEFRDVSATSGSIDLLLDNVRITRVLADGVLPEKPLIEANGAGWKLCLYSPDTGIYQLQRSGDLSDWSVISSTQVNTPGLVELNDPTPPGGRAFYRIGLVQP